MKMKLAALIMLLTVFIIPVVADDVDKWIQDLNDPILYVREVAVLTLKELNDTRAVEPLIQSLKNDQYSSVRQVAAESLGIIGDTRAVEPLIKALDDDDPLVRREATESLGIIGDTRAVGHSSRR